MLNSWVSKVVKHLSQAAHFEKNYAHLLAMLFKKPLIMTMGGIIFKCLLINLHYTTQSIKYTEKGNGL